MKASRFASLATEQSDTSVRGLDEMSVRQLVQHHRRSQMRVLQALHGAEDALVEAIDLVRQRLRAGGRLFLVGAGTSGRLAVLEAAECPPTFGTSRLLVQAVMAGGRRAVFASQEGAEDSRYDSVRVLSKRLRVGDVVVGIAASGITPFVASALRCAQQTQALPILLTCNPQARVPRGGHRVVLTTGAEILAGSTRLNAGTACKLALNVLTTGVMVGLGKVYGHRMVDVQPRSAKLRDRALRLVIDLGRVSRPRATKLLRTTRGRVKLAIVMARHSISLVDAQRRLRQANGFLRRVV